MNEKIPTQKNKERYRNVYSISNREWTKKIKAKKVKWNKYKKRFYMNDWKSTEKERIFSFRNQALDLFYIFIWRVAKEEVT